MYHEFPKVIVCSVLVPWEFGKGQSKIRLRILFLHNISRCFKEVSIELRPAKRNGRMSCKLLLRTRLGQTEPKKYRMLNSSVMLCLWSRCIYVKTFTKYVILFRVMQIVNKEGGLLLKDNFEGGATWAFEVGSQSMVCPIIVEDLNPPRQMLVEVVIVIFLISKLEL